MTRLQRSDALLLVVDLQERLMPVIDGADEVIANVERLVRGFHILGIPSLLTEQYVKGLGPTVAPLRRVFEETSGYRPIEKTCFSAHGAVELQTELRRLKKQQIVVAGVETHVCVYQTAGDLLRGGYEVTIVGDAVSSRRAENKAIGLQRMSTDGAKLSSTEMALFELLGVAATDEFRAVSRLLK